MNLWDLQDGKCALTGWPLSVETRNPNLATLDRIDNTKGYTTDNIRWTVWPANRMKRDMPEDDFISLVSAITDYTRSKITLTSEAPLAPSL